MATPNTVKKDTVESFKQFDFNGLGAVFVSKFNDDTAMIVERTKLEKRRASEAGVAAIAGSAGTVGGIALVIKIWDLIRSPIQRVCLRCN